MREGTWLRMGKLQKGEEGKGINPVYRGWEMEQRLSESLESGILGTKWIPSCFSSKAINMWWHPHIFLNSGPLQSLGYLIGISNLSCPKLNFGSSTLTLVFRQPQSTGCSSLKLHYQPLTLTSFILNPSIGNKRVYCFKTI